MERNDQIDILINNLGGGRKSKIWEMSVEDWDHLMRLNLRAMFLFTRQAATHIMKRRRGKIICLSSGAREGTPWLAGWVGLFRRQGRRAPFYSVRSARAGEVRHQC